MTVDREKPGSETMWLLWPPDSHQVSSAPSPGSPRSQCGSLRKQGSLALAGEGATGLGTNRDGGKQCRTLVPLNRALEKHI